MGAITIATSNKEETNPSISNSLYLWGKSESGCIGDKSAKTHKVMVPFRVPLEGYIPLSPNSSSLTITKLELGWKTSGILLSNHHMAYSKHISVR